MGDSIEINTAMLNDPNGVTKYKIENNGRWL
jgi:hypothetical protein